MKRITLVILFIAGLFFDVTANGLSFIKTVEKDNTDVVFTYVQRTENFHNSKLFGIKNVKTASQNLHDRNYISQNSSDTNFQSRKLNQAILRKHFCGNHIISDKTISARFSFPEDTVYSAETNYNTSRSKRN